MSDLREQFEKETQNQAIYRKFGIDYHTLKYVKWLESQLTQLQSKWNKLNTRPNDAKWISVEDELPEDTGYFLAYDEFYDRIGIGEIDSNIQYFNGSDDCNVTHWMSLPEPPVNL